MNKLNSEAKNLPLSITVDFSTPIHPCTIHVDWLQRNYYGLPCRLSEYSYKKLNIRSPSFHHIYEIYQGKKRKVTVACTPTQSFIDSKSNICKFDNDELYYAEPFKRMDEILTGMNLTFHNDTRIDICIDFNEFVNYLKPGNFIVDFIRGKYLKVGQKRFTMSAKQTLSCIPHSLKFMSKTSNITTNLYNKSLELREVHDKPYIRKAWIAAGLDITKDVWRLEVSIHNPKFVIINRITGEHVPFNSSRLDEPNYRNEIMLYLINKYFSFKYNNYDKKLNPNKLEALKDVNLFGKFYTESYVHFESHNLEASKREKKTIMIMNELGNECRKYSKELAESHQLITKYLTNKYLDNPDKYKIDDKAESLKRAKLIIRRLHAMRKFTENVSPELDTARRYVLTHYKNMHNLPEYLELVEGEQYKVSCNYDHQTKWKLDTGTIRFEPFFFDNDLFKRNEKLNR